MEQPASVLNKEKPKYSLLRKAMVTLKYSHLNRQDPMLNNKKDLQNYHEYGFDLLSSLSQTKGDFVELGGPSPIDYFFLV